MNHKIEFASHPANCGLVRDTVRRFLAGTGFCEEDIELLVLGVDEACTNVIRHVYKHEPTHLMALSCERLDDRIRFRLRDYGPPATVPNASRPIEVVQPGGLGMHLIKKAFDEVDYVLKKDGTQLVLVKKIPAKRSGKRLS